jgi:NTP pyrophosphatase (non-canonical NTP hydrolase)
MNKNLNYKVLDNESIKEEFNSSLEDVQDRVHNLARSNGFWEENTTLCELGYETTVQLKVAALIGSEVGELIDALRKDPTAHCGKHGCDLSKEEEELADIVIRVMDYCEHRNIDLAKCIIEKHNFNCTRPYKHGKNA